MLEVRGPACNLLNVYATADGGRDRKCRGSETSFPLSFRHHLYKETESSSHKKFGHVFEVGEVSGD